MNTYYISEIRLTGTKKAATKIEARNLTVAKMIANRKQWFYNTEVDIGSAVDEKEFITELLARKVNNTWIDTVA